MAGLVPAIHAMQTVTAATWMAGTRPAMTVERVRNKPYSIPFSNRFGAVSR